MTTGTRIVIAVVAVVLVVAGAWVYATSGRETTDDAQVDAHVTPVGARVGGTVTSVPVVENQPVDAGATLVEIDARDYEIALEKSKAELADAEAAAVGARADVPIVSTSATSAATSARGGAEHAQAGVREAEQGVEAARARLTTAHARLREAEATATRTARDVERLKALIAKDEIPQQMYDATVAAADAARAAADSARSLVAEAELGIRGAESRVAQARAGSAQADAQLEIGRTVPDQVVATQARAAAAAARVQQMQAAVKQAELNLQHATIKAPVKGFVSKKSVEVGQLVQAGQSLMTIIPLDHVWVTANFKETQLQDMKPGQRAAVTVDAYGGREYAGRLESLAAATGARFSLIPPDNATGNFVKVVQRVPVRITLDAPNADHLLRPGLSVKATVYTK